MPMIIIPKNTVNSNITTVIDVPSKILRHHDFIVRRQNESNVDVPSPDQMQDDTQGDCSCESLPNDSSLGTINQAQMDDRCFGEETFPPARASETVIKDTPSNLSNTHSVHLHYKSTDATTSMETFSDTTSLGDVTYDRNEQWLAQLLPSRPQLSRSVGVPVEELRRNKLPRRRKEITFREGCPEETAYVFGQNEAYSSIGFPRGMLKDKPLEYPVFGKGISVASSQPGPVQPGEFTAGPRAHGMFDTGVPIRLKKGYARPNVRFSPPPRRMNATYHLAGARPLNTARRRAADATYNAPRAKVTYGIPQECVPPTTANVPYQKTPCRATNPAYAAPIRQKMDASYRIRQRQPQMKATYSQTSLGTANYTVAGGEASGSARIANATYLTASKANITKYLGNNEMPLCTKKKEQTPMVQKVVIPKGMINPTETTIIEIPAKLHKQPVVIAKRKGSARSGMDDETSYPFSSSPRQNMSSSMSSTQRGFHTAFPLPQQSLSPIGPSAVIQGRSSRMTYALKSDSAARKSSPSTMGACQTQSTLQPTNLCGLDDTELEEQQTLQNSLREFQRARRKLLENTAALAAKNVSLSRSSLGNTRSRCPAATSNSRSTVQQPRSGSCDRQYIVTACSNETCPSNMSMSGGSAKTRSSSPGRNVIRQCRTR